MTTVVISSCESNNVMVAPSANENGVVERSNCAIIEMEINGNSGSPVVEGAPDSKTDTTIVLDNKHLLQVPGHHDDNHKDEEGDFDDE